MLSKKNIPILLLLLLAGFLRLYQLSTYMPFIGDYGWFYLSARDFLLIGTVPLVGITSSHTWLHQGPLWTYILAILFKFFAFNPVVPAVFIALSGVLTVFLLYKFGVELFGKTVAILAALFFATSPLIVIHNRVPYHTSLIPLFSLLFFYFLCVWVTKGKKVVPVITFLLALLYNLELATVIFIFLFMTLYTYGFIQKKAYVRGLTRKDICLAILAFLVPMLPILIYDMNHGFPQTIKFAGWIVYNFIKAFLPHQGSTSSDFIASTGLYIQRIFFATNSNIALLLFLLSIVWLGKITYDTKKDIYRLLFFVYSILIAGYVANKTGSEAYMPMFFPFAAYAFAIFCNLLISKSKLIIIAIGIGVLWNSYTLVASNYFMDRQNGYGVNFAKRTAVAKEIVKKANNQKYTLQGFGPGSNFKSFSNNYQYLTWLYGNEPSSKKENVRFVFIESIQNLTLLKPLK